jgi:hypothetical protein
MTTRSTRRAAEQELIDAAIAFSNAPFYSNPGPLEARLRRAVDAYTALGLDDTNRPIVGNTTTDTSAEAGASMADHVGKLARQCFDEIAVVYRNDGVGLTVDQLEQLLDRSHQSVSARVNELRDKGWVRDSGQRRKTRSGRKAIVWSPTEMALTR